MRSNPASLEAAIAASLASYASYLVANSLAVTVPNLFACHIFGTATVAEMLADTTALAADIVDATDAVSFPRYLYNADGSKKKVPLLCCIATLDELEYFRHGGIMQYVLRNLAAA